MHVYEVLSFKQPKAFITNAVLLLWFILIVIVRPCPVYLRLLVRSVLLTHQVIHQAIYKR